MTTSSAYSLVWSVVGSAGVVNPAEAANVIFNGSVVQLGQDVAGVGGIGGAAVTAAARAPVAVPGHPSQKVQAVLRYSVAPVPSFPTLPADAGGAPDLFFNIRWRVGDGEVICRLKKVDVLTGTEDVLMATGLPEGTGPRDPSFYEWTDSITSGNALQEILDFVRYVYYVELTLSATRPLVSSAAAAFTAPAVALIQMLDKPAARQLGFTV